MNRTLIGVILAIVLAVAGVTIAGQKYDSLSPSSPKVMQSDDTIVSEFNESLGARKVTLVALDPCVGAAKTSIPINIATATTTEVTASLAGTGNHYYVCGIDVVTAAANNVALVDDDTDGCGSPTSGLAGGTTAATGWNFGANGGLVKGNGSAMVYKTNGTNRVLCLVTSAATQLSGSLQVVAAP